MSEQQEIMKLAMGKIMARAFIDEVYKSKLISNPRSVFSEIGLSPPPHIQIKILENTQQKIYITLPAPWANMDDPDFMKKLHENPRPVLATAGMDIADNVKIHIIENTPHITHIVIPLAPGPEEISIEEI